MPDGRDPRTAAPADVDAWRVLADLPLGLVAHDAEGIARWCNRRVAELLRTDVGDVVGHTIDHVADRAAQLALDVSSARNDRGMLVLREPAEVDAARLDFFGRVSDELSSSLNLDRTLDRIVSVAVPHLADACFIAFTDGLDVMRLGAAVGEHGLQHIDERRLEIDDLVPAVARVRASGVSEIRGGLVADDHADVIPPAAAWEPLRRLAPTTALIVPLRARAAPIGALALLAAGRAPYTARDAAIAEGFARRAAIAIDNALIYRDRSSVARVLQASLLPDQLPDVVHLDLGARYRPLTLGSEIGGDFYDVFEVDGGRWIVAVGDACGKGVEAATLTGLARHTIRAIAGDHDLSGVLHRLNDAVRQRPQKTFCTVALAEVRPAPDGAAIEVVTGGHPAPIVVRADGTVQELATKGTLVGILPAVHFTPQSIELSTGDALVLYTDGVIEARAGRREFGVERLLRILASCGGLQADAMADRVVQEVADFTGGPQTDDIAVVVVRSGGRP